MDKNLLLFINIIIIAISLSAGENLINYENTTKQHEINIQNLLNNNNNDTVIILDNNETIEALPLRDDNRRTRREPPIRIKSNHLGRKRPPISRRKPVNRPPRRQKPKPVYGPPSIKQPASIYGPPSYSYSQPITSYSNNDDLQQSISYDFSANSQPPKPFSNQYDPSIFGTSSFSDSNLPLSPHSYDVSPPLIQTSGNKGVQENSGYSYNTIPLATNYGTPIQKPNKIQQQPSPISYSPPKNTQSSYNTNPFSTEGNNPSYVSTGTSYNVGPPQTSFNDYQVPRGHFAEPPTFNDNIMPKRPVQTLHNMYPAPGVVQTPQNTNNHDNNNNQYSDPYEQSVSSYDVPLNYGASKNNYYDYTINPPEPPRQTYELPQHKSVPFDSTPKYTQQKEQYSPPILPNTYDQEQFSTFSKNSYANILPNHNYRDRDRDYLTNNDYSTLFNVNQADDTKKVNFKTTTRQKLPPPAYTINKYNSDELDDNDDDYYNNNNSPSDEYLDELITTSSTTTTTRRPKQRRNRTKISSSTQHILDADELRDAFSSGSTLNSFIAKPDYDGVAFESKRNILTRNINNNNNNNLSNFVLLSTINGNNTFSGNRRLPSSKLQSTTPPTTTNHPNRKYHSNFTNFDIVSIQKSNSHSFYAGTVAPNYSFGEKIDHAFKSRIDDNINFDDYDDGMIPLNNFKKPENTHNKYKIYKNYDTGAAITSIPPKLQTTTTVKSLLWDGKTLPKNHKFTERDIHLTR